MTQVTVDRLRAAAELFFSHLEENNVRSVTFSEDYYWDVPARDRYDPYKEPKELTIGQLSDDLTGIERMMDGSNPTIGYGLVWLGSLLRRVGETANC